MITVKPCRNCIITVKDGHIRWLCDDYHPEVLGVLLAGQSIREAEICVGEDIEEMNMNTSQDMNRDTDELIDLREEDA